MKFEIRNRIAVLALGAGLLLGGNAPQIACADANSSVAQSGTVLVPRLVKGARTAEMVRVPAGQYNANGFRVEAQSRNCPGTVCPKTTNCYDIKGALGARCIAR